MARQFQLRRGTTIENETFVGAVGELTYDVQKKEHCLRFDVELLANDEYDAGYARQRAGLVAVDPDISINKIS